VRFDPNIPEFSSFYESSLFTCRSPLAPNLQGPPPDLRPSFFFPHCTCTVEPPPTVPARRRPTPAERGETRMHLPVFLHDRVSPPFCPKFSPSSKRALRVIVQSRLIRRDCRSPRSRPLPPFFTLPFFFPEDSSFEPSLIECFIFTKDEYCIGVRGPPPFPDHQ